MQIESLSIKNYKAFKDVELKNLPAMAVFIGANGTGKSTLFDVFAFLKDALRDGVKKALQSRGGFKEVVTRGAEDEAIEFVFQFKKQYPMDFFLTYELSVQLNEQEQPEITLERLQYLREGGERAVLFFDATKNIGLKLDLKPVNTENSPDLPTMHRELFEAAFEEPWVSHNILLLKTLGDLIKPSSAAYPISRLQNFLESSYISNLDETSKSQLETLSEEARELFNTHPEAFDLIKERLAQQVPGMSDVKLEITKDNRVLLEFQDGSFKSPFMGKHISDGTMRLFAYQLLLHNPKIHPLLCVEEPENQLYNDVLAGLAEEFYEYAHKGGQVFINTHSPEFLNHVPLESVFYLVKKEGVTTIHRASDDEQLRAFIAEGDHPGYLWKQGLFPGLERL